jgi:site-specific DNA-methyltransferase (adenine-specific)
MKPYYEHAGITIYHGSCLDVLPRLPCLPSVLVTDPPYTAAGGSTNGRTSDADTQFFEFWLRAVSNIVRGAMHPEARGFVFCDWRTSGLIAAAFREPGERQTAKGWSCSQRLVWDREHIGLGTPFRNSFEMIAVVGGMDADWSHMPKNIPTIVRHRWPYGAKEFHGAEKPVGLLRQLLTWADPCDVPGRIVIDPFMGSGSTLVACKQTGRIAIGIEQEERYCEIAAKRLQQEALPLEVA